MIIFEHTVPGLLVWLALIAGGTAAGISYYRYVRRDGVGLLLAGLRLLFLVCLAWCLFMPQLRKQFTNLKKPRFLVAVDTSGSMALSPSPEAPTRWDRAKAALQAPWVSVVQAECDVDAYPFDTEQGRRVDMADIEALEPSGEATRLRDVLQRLGDRYRGQPVAGMVLLSDGIDTEERHGSWAREEWPWPVYALRLEPEGVWNEEPELRIDSVETPRRVTVGWQTELKTIISGQGTGGKPVHVRLLRDGALQEEIPVRVPREGGSCEATFRLSHPEIGTFTYDVAIPPYPSETVTNNNRYAVGVQVVDARNRLLYVEGPPRWESKFLTRALRANRQVTPVCFIRGPGGEFFTVGPRGGVTANMTEAELALFKIIVLGDLSGEELGAERTANLLAFVDSGGSLLLLGGTKAWGADGFRATALADLLPVKSLHAEPIEERAAVTVTGAGKSHAAFGGGAALWEALPPVLSVFQGAVLPAGAEVLATAATAAGDQPLIVSQRYGQGKVVAVLTDSLWRWQLSPDTGDARPYQRFWDQLLAWMSPTARELEADEIDLFAEREHLYLGETIELNARLGGRSAGDAAAQVTCEVTTPDGRRVPYSMSRQDVVTPTGKTLPGHTVSFSARRPGLHRAVAVCAVGGRRAESDPISFYVRPFTPEEMPRPPDNLLLQTLCRSSKGRFFNTPEQLSDFLEGAGYQRSEEQQLLYTSLWQRLPLLSCLLLLASIEWIVRRWRNMP